MLCLRDFFAFLFCLVSLFAKSSHGAEIINGKEVQPHSLPFMALLQKRTPACGGILIDPEWVLTAAHCGKIEKVLLGVHTISKKERESRQVRKVQIQVPHPCYDATNNINDVMLLKLDKPVTETQTVKWLKVENYVKDPQAGDKCLVAGWGRTIYNVRKMSDVLMSVNVTVIDRVKCNEYYLGKAAITSSMVCAGSDDENEADTCQGDSGGPLLCNGALVGVTSFGYKCGLRDKPGVYSFLTEKQLNWINKTLKKA